MFPLTDALFVSYKLAIANMMNVHGEANSVSQVPQAVLWAGGKGIQLRGGTLKLKS
jgi:hypothetical protein